MTLALLVIACMFPPVFQVARSVASGVVTRSRSFAACLAGLAAVFVASAAQLALDSVLPELAGVPAFLVSAFLEAALVEETAKLALTAAVCAIGRPSARLPARGVVSVALTVGLSFSSFETLSYALGASSFPWYRLISALPVHAASAVCAGALVAAVPGSRRPALGAFALAVALHGAYTAALSLRAPSVAIAFASACALVALAVRSARSAVRAGAVVGDAGYGYGEGRPKP